MAFIPTMNQPKGTYDLINMAINVVGGFGNIQSFYDEAFAGVFDKNVWPTLFPQATPTIEETYLQVKSRRHLPVMARYIAFDAEAPKIANEGFQASSGTIPKMGLDTDYNEKSLKDSLKIMQNMGGQPNLNAIFDEFLVSNTKLIEGLHKLINHTALQIESTGKYVSKPIFGSDGLMALEFDFQVPASNKRACGGYGRMGKKAAWSDTENSYPIGDLQDMLKYAEGNFFPVNLVFRMDKSTWNTLVNHPTTKRLIAIKATGGGITDSNIDLWPSDEKDVRNYLSNIGLPPIEVVNEIGVVDAHNPATRKIEKKAVRSFAENTVVLRPTGSIGELQWSYPVLDFSNGQNQWTTDGGKFLIQEIVDTKNRARMLHAEFTGLPVMDTSDDMLYLDVSKATA